MFKWMISGHRSGKSKREKLNNNNDPKKKSASEPSTGEALNNGEIPAPQQDSGIKKSEDRGIEPCHQVGPLHPQQLAFRNMKNAALAASKDNLNESNEYSTLEAIINQRANLKPVNGERFSHQNGLGLSNSELFTAGSQPNLHEIHASQPQDFPRDVSAGRLQVPNTCTLPRRSILKDTSGQRDMSPPWVRNQPPPYTHHQTSEYFRTMRRPRLPPAPPRPPSIKSPENSVNIQETVTGPLARSRATETRDSPSSECFRDFDVKLSPALDSGFDSMSNPSNSLSDQVEYSDIMQKWDRSNKFSTVLPDSFPSKSTENLITASSVPTVNYESERLAKNGLGRACMERCKESKTCAILSDSVYPECSKEYYNGKAFVNQAFCAHQDKNTNASLVEKNQCDMNTWSICRKTLDQASECNPEPHCTFTKKADLDHNHVSYNISCREEYLTGTNEQNSSKPFENQNSNKILSDKIKQQSSQCFANSINTGLHPCCYKKSSGSSETTPFEHVPNSREFSTFGKSLESASFDLRCCPATDHGPRPNPKPTDSISPSSSWMEWTQQLNAYTTWVNSQLSKRGEKKLIVDLRRDFQNGVIFADLIEILAGEKVAGICRSAETYHQSRENIDRVLQFMSTKHIKMTHIASKEIAEGNLKSIMRLILALAAHYKPQSVREGTDAASNGAPPSSRSNEVQTSELCSREPRQNFPKKKIMHDVGVGPDTPLNDPSRTPSLFRRSLAFVEGTNDHPSKQKLRRQPSLNSHVRPTSPTIPVYENIPRGSGLGSTRWAYDSLRASHKFHWDPSLSPNKNRNSLAYENKPFNTRSLSCDNSDDLLSTSFNSESSRCASLETSVEYDPDAKNGFLQGSLPSSSVNKPAALQFWQQLQKDTGIETDSPKDNCDFGGNFRYHTIHRMSGRRRLPRIPGRSSSSASSMSRGETPPVAQPLESPLEEGTRERKGVPGVSFLAAASSREPEGRSQNSSPAASVDRRCYGNDDPLDPKTAMNKDSVVDWTGSGLVSGAEASTPQLQDEILRHILSRRSLENEKAELCKQVSEKEELISELRSQLMEKERRTTRFRGDFDHDLGQTQGAKSVRVCRDENGRGSNRDEIGTAREALAALRNIFRESDSSRHPLDALERALSLVMDRLQTSAEQPELPKNDKKFANKNGYVEYSTKVIYYTERSVTPFMSTVPKRLGEVTLRDFRALFDRPGSFRFHFKNQDPEYGLVKEEISNDDETLPGVDGKIIAWVEEDLE